MAIRPYRSPETRPTIVTCAPCQRRARSTGGHKASYLYLVRGRVGVDQGHLVYQAHADPDQAVLLCLAPGRPVTERAAEALAFPVGTATAWNLYRDDDGSEIDSEANPAGSWLVNRFETEEGPRWAIQAPWDDAEINDRTYDDEIAAIADAVAMMVASALSGDEQDGDRD